MSSDFEFDIVTRPDSVSVVKPAREHAWELKVSLPKETYTRDEVAFVVEEVAEYLSNPGGDFEICAASVTRDGKPYTPATAADANPSASAPDGVAMPPDAAWYATVSELDPHCFAQADFGFHNLTVVRRAGDETEVLVRVAGGAGAHFRLKPDARNALVAALLRPA